MASSPLFCSEGLNVTGKAGMRGVMAAGMAGLLATALLASPFALAQDLDTARAAFEALPEEARKSIQDDLVWSGVYNGSVDGEYGRRTHQAVVDFERRAGGRADGILDGAERKALTDLAARARAAVGFAMQADPKTGMRIGIPAKLLTTRSDLPSGSQWRGALGRATLSSADLPGTPDDLTKLYETRSTDTANNRRVTYRVLRPDWFVVTGEIGPRRFYTRYATDGSRLRGYTIAYDASAARQWEPLVIAIANSVEAFPSAATDGQTRPGPTAQGASPGAGLSGRAAALVVAADRAIAAVESAGACKTILVGGKPARVEATQSGLALLAVEGLAAPQPAIALATDATLPQAPVVIGAGGDGLVAMAAEARGGAIHTALQPGMTGAAVFDRSGRLAAFLTHGPASRTLVSGLAPAMMQQAMAANAIDAFLRAQGVVLAPGSPGSAMSTGGIVAAGGRSILPLTCR